MGSYVFYHCDSLSEVTLGSGLTSLPSYAFAQCPKLANIVLPYRMTKINDNAFNACTGLTEVTMPRSMASIGSQVFSYPGKLTIYGIKGTYAETYANDNGITFVNREVNAEKAELNETSLRIGKGYSKQLFLTVTPATFTDEVAWKSGNPEIATVTEDGEIRGVSCGTTTVKVTVGNASFTCNVTVTQPVTSIRLSQGSATMAAGDKLALTAEVYPNDATDKSYRWSSSNPAVASVNEQGEVTALAKGEATVSATASDGSEVAGTCAISVTSQMVTAAAVEDLQSPHPYENNCTDSWQYTLNGAGKINVRFNGQTEMEDGFDYIHLYDKNNKLVGTYTGKQLAGKEVTILGDTVRIKLETDKGGTAWGFRVDSVTQASGSGTGDPEDPDPENPTTAFAYTRNINNTITITKCTSSDANITIPSQIDGRTVTGIGDNAFRDMKSITTVTIPSGVGSIGKYAFAGCTSLKVINLPKTLTAVSEHAFLNSGITTIKYSGTSADWGKVVISATGNQALLNATVTGSDNKTFSANKSKWLTEGKPGTTVKKPSVSKVKSFKAKSGRKKLTLSWKKLSGAAGYQLQISTKKNFKGAKTISVSKSKKSYTKKRLQSGKKYYARIRAYKTYKNASGKTLKAYGNWVKISKKVK